MKRCKQCILEGNFGKCDKDDCANTVQNFKYLINDKYFGLIAVPKNKDSLVNIILDYKEFTEPRSTQTTVVNGIFSVMSDDREKSIGEYKLWDGIFLKNVSKDEFDRFYEIETI